MTIRGPFAIALLVLLFLSVAGNLMIAGFTLARVSGARPPNEIERIVALGIRAFPPQIRDEIAARGRDQRQAIRGQLRQVEQARREMFAAMRAEPFDPAALERSYEALRMATAELQRAGQQIVSGVLADAPPEVRRNIRHRRGPRPR